MLNADTYLEMARRQAGGDRSEELRKEQAAIDFEEIFARQLVREMTKNSFRMSGAGVGPGDSSHLYREFITDALAGELAARRALGMADLVTRYWSQSEGTSGQEIHPLSGIGQPGQSQAESEGK